MTITTDLIQSQQLKAWGAPQGETSYYWIKEADGDWYGQHEEDESSWKREIHESIDSYNLEELILWLKREVGNTGISLYSGKKGCSAALLRYNSLRSHGNTLLEAVFKLAAAIYQSKQSEV